MKALKIEEEKRQELTINGIVICTYKDLDGNEFDGIGIEFKDDYPTFEEITIKDEE
jgi:hypothetical protein